ncbi:hypothetical protein BOQ37_14950 [Listeria monocytogenes]|nr:hypothetical protein [Listeria monocytogenes]EAE8309414.1 hypothetical protein [Listeria monocytogenes]EAF2801625.1 hypothetical protein [Listeria monocytogenes]EHD1581872.1 hypothetical protein [Listeria monocytogenes]
MEFNSLSDEERVYLSSQGFSEEQEYQQTTIIEISLKAGARSLMLLIILLEQSKSVPQLFHIVRLRAMAEEFILLIQGKIFCL